MPIQNSINNLTGFLTVDPATSGDSYIQFNINAMNEYRMGVDDDDADSFKISQGAALGTNDHFTISSNGERILPLQPSFEALINTGPQDVTGDGTLYTLVYDAESYDIGNNFDGTSTFTAPVDGIYHCVLSVELTNMNIASGYTNYDIWFAVNATAPFYRYLGYAHTQNGNHLTFQTLLQLSASDAVTTLARVSGGAKTVDVQGNSGTGGFITNYFSGRLVA